MCGEESKMTTFQIYLHDNFNQSMVSYDSIWVLGLILNMILPLLPSSWASPLPLDMRYLFLVGSNILLLMVFPQWVAVLQFLQEKMCAHPSTLPSSLFNKWSWKYDSDDVGHPACIPDPEGTHEGPGSVFPNQTLGASPGSESTCRCKEALKAFPLSV